MIEQRKDEEFHEPRALWPFVKKDVHICDAV